MMLYVCGLDVREFFCAELKDNDATWWKSFLSYVRLEQMQRLKQIADWKRCVAAGFLEWYGLQCLYGEQMPPKTAIADNGKPYFSEFPGLHYNLSHAGDFVVAAFSDEPVGIDIAERRECKDSLIRRCLTETEMGWLKEQVDRNEAFCRLWAGKESFVKWTGDGLRKDLQQVEVTLDGAFFVRDLNPGETGGGRWRDFGEGLSEGVERTSGVFRMCMLWR